jgi:hypothetical protein
LTVFIADLDRYELISFALFTSRAGRFFFRKCGKKEVLEQEKSKDNAVRMDDGRYGTFCVEDLGFLLRISVALG